METYRVHTVAPSMRPAIKGHRFRSTVYRPYSNGIGSVSHTVCSLY
jgi:hypothetical protein